MEWRGVYTAIVTPFEQNGEIDWSSFERLVEAQVSAGVTGLVVCGTTGESPTLTEREQGELISRTVKQCRGRCQVIGGTGSNSTAHAVALTRHAVECGVDGVLVVNPYYNKPTQEGLFRHFSAVAQASSVPVMVYNIKGRTAVNVETATLLRLIEACPRISAVKEASGDLNQMKDVLARAPQQFAVLSGDDNLTVPLMKMGGRGVVSVASNVFPVKMVQMVNAALATDWQRAESIEQEMAPFFEALFFETNPIPVKAVLAKAGWCKEIYRLPMCEISSKAREKLNEVVSRYAIPACSAGVARV